MDDEGSSGNEPAGKPELALDFNFVPTWARQPPENPYAGREAPAERERERGRPERRDDRRGGFGRGPGGDRRGPRPGGLRPDGARPGGGRPGGGFRRPEGDRFSRPQGEGERGPFRGGDRGPRRPPREPLPRLDVQVAFLPDRERLALVVRDIQASRRAFPLIEIASRFLGREDSYAVKLELPPPAAGAPAQTFVQCLECKRVFRARANAEAHVVNDHLDKYFAVEETAVEPPAGAFTCVARCRLSGALLGPPNHHGYNEKIQELWATRFAHMSKAEYLGHVETVRDEALVEQWKASLRKKTVYRLKEVPEGQEAPALGRAEAQDWMRAGKVSPLLRESRRCQVPGPQAKQFDDPALRAVVSLAWQRETRFPFTLALALRPAFRHMRLHLFKVNARETYVTAVPPKPVDLATAPAIVQDVVAFLEAHPGAMRQQVLDGLRPGADPESPGAAELLLHLNNLIANGGIIEFFNATLAPARGVPPAARKAGTNAAADVPKVEAEEPPVAAEIGGGASPGAEDGTEVSPADPAPAAAAPGVDESAAGESAAYPPVPEMPVAPEAPPE